MTDNEKAAMRASEQRILKGKRDKSEMVGCRVHVPCHVNHGPFPNERRVLIDHHTDKPWFGFVTIDNLNQQIKKGDDLVRGVIVAADHQTMTVRIYGEAVGDSCVVLKR